MPFIFPFKYIIRSQRVDIGPYLDKLEGIRRSQENMLLNVLMDDYVQFIDVLAQEANIMDKSFFVIVPFSPAGDSVMLSKRARGSLEKIIPSANQSSSVVKIDKATYEKAKDEIKIASMRLLTA
ncbi:hypothetical protein IPF89_04430 [Candidatus Saccharibacteria bacterium]|nr:MAG: hypothetical protein IPF89_04430 [Candidatus Saccharibacteria bacterium]